jgi:hypothetical protein
MIIIIVSTLTDMPPIPHKHRWKSYQDYQKQKKNKFTGNLPTNLKVAALAALGQSGFARLLVQSGEMHYSPTSSHAGTIRPPVHMLRQFISH